METLKNDLILCSVSRMYAFAVKRDLPSLFETEHPWTTPRRHETELGLSRRLCWRRGTNFAPNCTVRLIPSRLLPLPWPWAAVGEEGGEPFSVGHTPLPGLGGKSAGRGPSYRGWEHTQDLLSFQTNEESGRERKLSGPSLWTGTGAWACPGCCWAGSCPCHGSSGHLAQVREAHLQRSAPEVAGLPEPRTRTWGHSGWTPVSDNRWETDIRQQHFSKSHKGDLHSASSTGLSP